MKPRRHSPRNTGAGRFPSVSLLLTAIAALVFLWPGLSRLFEYDRTAVAAGQLWRLVSWHWAHWSADHLLWDAGAFAALCACCERLDRRRCLACLVLSGILISAVTWFARPDLAACRGFSGIASALFGLAAVRVLLSAFGRRDAWATTVALILLAGFGAKVIVEVATGATVFVASQRAGMVPMPLAHCTGLLVGIVAALWPPGSSLSVSLEEGTVGCLS